MDQAIVQGIFKNLAKKRGYDEGLMGDTVTNLLANSYTWDDGIDDTAADQYIQDLYNELQGGVAQNVDYNFGYLGEPSNLRPSEEWWSTIPSDADMHESFLFDNPNEMYLRKPLIDRMNAADPFTGDAHAAVQLGAADYNPDGNSPTGYENITDDNLLSLLQYLFRKQS